MRRVTCTLLAVLVGVLGIDGPAFAQLYGHADSVHDVMEGGYCDDGGELCFPATYLPDQREGDIVRANVRHQSTRLLVRIRERQVSAAGTRSVYLQIRTNEGVRRFVEVHAYPGRLQPTEKIMRRGEYWDGAEMACSGLWAGNDSSLDMATVIVPRRCLGYPRWVRVSVGTTAGSATSGWQDDLMSSRTDPQEASFIYTPRIYRG